MKVIKTDVSTDGRVTLYFSDGGALRSATNNGRDWIFFVGDPDRCNKIGNGSYPEYVGKCAFVFYFNPKISSTKVGWNFEPYAPSWDGDVETLKKDPTYGCLDNPSSSNLWHAYCTKWIQYNGWKIPDEYPFKVYYK